MENYIRPGYGFYDVTVYPYGGDFHRVGTMPLEIMSVTESPKKGIYLAVVVSTGRKVAVQRDALGVINHDD